MSLNVVALISGGKDSLFSILHCLANGHKIIALANLHPSSDQDDTDSFMYQTVGHQIIPLYAEALGLPLYRQEILGSAVRTERDYSYVGGSKTPPELDETESLVPLLEKVKAAHPEVNAVSTGAILSNYQRTRVESVALRVGLAPLSFLWQYPFLPPYSKTQLLYDMAALGQDARIIKVASGGLDSDFLWENVADARTIHKLQKAMARFGESGVGAVIGEGGEFETLAIDGPDCLWKKRIEVEEGDIVTGAGTAIWRATNARVESKLQRAGDEATLSDLRIPELWDVEFKELLHKAPEDVQPPRPAEESDDNQSARREDAFLQTFDRMRISATASTIAIPNLTHNRYTNAPNIADVATQAQFILSQLLTQISMHGEDLTPGNIVHVTLLLRDMSSFAAVNNTYSQILMMANPPSRVTVACGDMMPEHVDVMMSVVVSREKKEGLHVQSRSYWAPANIGPYSQAITIPLGEVKNNQTSTSEEEKESAKAVYIAGQIPLVPASMNMYTEKGFEGQAFLALQHLWRIGGATNVSFWTCGLAYISSCSAVEAQRKAKLAQGTWTAAVGSSFAKWSDNQATEEPDELIDLWEQKNRLNADTPFHDQVSRTAIPNFAVAKGEAEAPPCFAVMVESLPRGAEIEWHSTGLNIPHTSLVAKTQSTTPLFYSASIPSANTMFVAYEILEKGKTGHDYKVWSGMAERERMIWEHVTVYAGPELPREWAGVVKGVQWVPCYRVWGAEGREVGGVLLARVTITGEWDGGIEEL